MRSKPWIRRAAWRAAQSQTGWMARSGNAAPEGAADLRIDFISTAAPEVVMACAMP